MRLLLAALGVRFRLRFFAPHLNVLRPSLFFLPRQDGVHRVPKLELEPLHVDLLADGELVQLYLLVRPTSCIESLHLMGLDHVPQVALLLLSAEGSESLALFQSSLFESELDFGLSVPCAIHHLLLLEAILMGTSVA